MKTAEDSFSQTVNEVIVPAYFNDAQRQATVNCGVLKALSTSQLLRHYATD
jgi:molecular chaperone DnaK (HSP70)